MNDAQAEALSRIFAEMATKSDLLVFQEQVNRRLRLLEGQMAHLRTDLTGQMAQLRADLTGEMARHSARQTTRMIAIIILFGTVLTIVNAFIG